MSHSLSLMDCHAWGCGSSPQWRRNDGEGRNYDKNDVCRAMGLD